MITVAADPGPAQQLSNMCTSIWDTHRILSKLCLDLLDDAVLLDAGELLGCLQDVAIQLQHRQLRRC